MLCRVCIAQIQPSEHVLDHADSAAPTQKRELRDHTDLEHTSSCSERYIGIDNLSDVWNSSNASTKTIKAKRDTMALALRTLINAQGAF